MWPRSSSTHSGTETSPPQYLESDDSFAAVSDKRGHAQGCSTSTSSSGQLHQNCRCIAIGIGERLSSMRRLSGFSGRSSGMFGSDACFREISTHRSRLFVVEFSPCTGGDSGSQSLVSSDVGRLGERKCWATCSGGKEGWLLKVHEAVPSFCASRSRYHTLPLATTTGLTFCLLLQHVLGTVYCVCRRR